MHLQLVEDQYQQVAPLTLLRIRQFLYQVHHNTDR